MHPFLRSAGAAACRDASQQWWRHVLASQSFIFFRERLFELARIRRKEGALFFFWWNHTPSECGITCALNLGGENVSEMFLHFPMNSGWARPRRESFIVFIHLVRSSSFSRGLKIVHLRLFFRLLSAVCRVLGRLLMDFSGKSRARMNHSVFLFVLMTLSDVRAKTMKK